METSQKIQWTRQKRKIGELNPADYNPRVLTSKQAQDLQQSLSKFQLVDPIIINADNKIIGGHQRYFILKQSGQEDVDVRVPDRLLDQEEERELNLRLNKNTGQFDFDKLADFDEEMLMGVGFEANELDDIFDIEPAEDQQPEEPPAQPWVKRGDIFKLGDHLLMCGDATDPADIARLFGEEKADILFTDPPYNVDYAGRGENTSNGIKNDDLDPEDFKRFINKAFEQMHTIMRPGAVYYICSGWSSFAAFETALLENAFYRAGVIIWQKESAGMGWNDYRYKHEWILVGKRKENRVKALAMLYGWRKDGPHYFRGTHDEVDVWEVPRKKTGSYKHPTEKPVWLIEKALANSSQRGWIVADLFGGSGATLIAAERLSRRARIMELDPRYVQVQLERWTRYTGETAEKLNGDAIGGAAAGTPAAIPNDNPGG